MNLESEINNHTSSLPILPMLPKNRSPIIKDIRVDSKTHLIEQQEKHLKSLQDKQPFGRDGKRIPLPMIQKKNTKPKSETALHKSGEVKFSKFSGFN